MIKHLHHLLFFLILISPSTIVVSGESPSSSRTVTSPGVVGETESLSKKTYSASSFSNEDSDRENRLSLPSLGDSASGIASHEQEYELGQAWLRMYRSRVPLAQDPLMYDYLWKLINKLANHSALEDRRLTLIVIPNPTINAFAVPGGVVGVNTGIFLSANNEQELAGVLAHEFAHLSQRHFARDVEKSRQSTIPTMAGLLGGLALMATTGSDAGIAAIMATQAASLESRLRFSRDNEAEADRVGMQTLVNAEMNPNAMADMFELMQRSMRFSGDRPPEFLLTHPVTEKRIADARSRADQYPVRKYAESPTFQLMRARARVSTAENPSVALKYFRSEIAGQNAQPTANIYGLALAQIQMRQFDAADTTLAPLYVKEPDNEAYLLAKADILVGQKKMLAAQQLLERYLQKHADSYPVLMAYAPVLNAQGKPDAAIKQLEKLLLSHSADPAVWYQLAEIRGQAGDVGGVHTARAEYFMLNGAFDQARQQLTYALKIYNNNYIESARVKQRLRDLAELEQQTLRI